MAPSCDSNSCNRTERCDGKCRVLHFVTRAKDYSIASLQLIFYAYCGGNVEDAIAELRAAFADLMGDSEEEGEPDADSLGAPSDDDSDNEEEMEGFGESVALKSVTAKMPNGEDSSAKSPVGKGGKGTTDAKPHPTDTKVENGGKAPSAKAMNVKGPEAGAKLSAAPAPKREMK